MAGDVPPPEGLPTAYLNTIIAGAVAILIALIVVLSMIVTRLSKYIRLRDDISEDDKEYVKQRNPMEMIRNKAFIGIVVAIFTAVLAKEGLDALFSIGVQQGYAPKQPIAYWYMR